MAIPYAIAFSFAVPCSIVRDSKQLLFCSQAIPARSSPIATPTIGHESGVALIALGTRETKPHIAGAIVGALAFTGRRVCVSGSGLRGLRTCAFAASVAALLAVIGLGMDDGAAQPRGGSEMEVVRG